MDSEKIYWQGWETVSLIGRGSFGAVYELRRTLLEETESAALKVISIPQSNNDIEELYSDGYDDESITATFKEHLKSIIAEYSLMRKMNDCVNIVKCDDVRYVQHDSGIGWDIFIKMELLTPLTKALPDVIPEKTVLALAKDMCRALMECKKHNIIHRDIKPQNIFISKNGHYKLGDFGIAKTVEQTMGGTKIGTYKYMAPEVYHCQPYGHTADIYSLGLVLYWLLNERRMPFMPLPPEKLSAGMEEQARSRRFSGEQLPPPKNGSTALKKIVLKACAYDPKDRYQEALHMWNDLAVLDGPASTPTPPPVVKQNPQPTPSPVVKQNPQPTPPPVVKQNPQPTPPPVVKQNPQPTSTKKPERPNPVPKATPKKDGKKPTPKWLLPVVLSLVAVLVIVVGLLIVLQNADFDLSEWFSGESSTSQSKGHSKDQSKGQSKDQSKEPSKEQSKNPAKETTAPMEVSIREITVASAPLKTSYVVGDSLDTSGLQLEVIYSDGETQYVQSGFQVDVQQLNTPGEQTVTVTYYGKTAQFTVHVESAGEKKAVRAEIQTAATKTTYYIGDKISTQGLSLLVHYNDGTSETVTGVTCSPSSFSKAGQQTVTVQYGTLTATYPVRVVNPSIQLDSTAANLTLDCLSFSTDTSKQVPYWKVPLPKVQQTTPSNVSVTWSVASGSAYISNSELRIQKPGTVVARATFTYNGYSYHADYTVQLGLYMQSKGDIYLMKEPRIDAGTDIFVPAQKKVTITEVSWNWSTKETKGKHWLWGKVTYNGVTGWAEIS